MLSMEDWLRANEEYLAAAVAWVRWRLEQRSGPLETKTGSGGKWFQWQGTASATADRSEEPFKTHMLQAAAVEPPPALLMLSHRLGLSPFEQDLLLLCAAVELDTRVPTLCGQAQGNPNFPYPTFALAMALFDSPSWEALSPESPLRRWRLLEINQPGSQPLTTSPLRADERIVNYLKGLNYLDDRLAPLLIPFDVPVNFETDSSNLHLPPSQAAIAATVETVLRQAASDGQSAILQLIGADETSKQLIAGVVASHLGLNLFRFPVTALPGQTTELELLARLWERESSLLPLVIFLDAQEVDQAGEGEKSTQAGGMPLRSFLARCRGLFLVSTREVLPGLSAWSMVLDVDKPTPAEQRAAWNTLLGENQKQLADRLAGQFNLNVPAIQQISRVFKDPPQNGNGSQVERIWKTCLARTRPRLDVLAERIETKATWENLVLPDQETNLLHQISDQVEQRSRVYDDWGFRHKMNRGLGISALFGGESGTGKTMAAEVIANELQLNLYRIDLSAVVSKYIGETEKNLRRLFDAAEDGGAILFFDEADALFGKRSEVKDSHDRYANIEINYLLQRMEAYRGLAVLATNKKSALDQAFLRRLRFIVNFPFPNREDRARIWRGVFPAQTPLDELDFNTLARLNLTGGGIHNIAIGAAFMAAKNGSAVSMPLILEAARSEFRKMGLAVNETMFRWHKPVAVGEA
jgi:hypothetical protein